MMFSRPATFRSSRFSAFLRSGLRDSGVGGLALVSLVLAACSGSPSSTKEGTSEDAGPTTPPVSSFQSVASGSNCTNITEEYAICTDVSLCPGVSIDQTKFPQCGYSVHDDAIDPECLCYGMMCPMGAPGSCTDMAGILASTSWDAVCQQYAGGHCLDIAGSGQTACAVCKQNCAGNPACLSSCGC
jgi:hypothetical protein